MRTISELAPNIEYVSRFDEELGALLGGELRRHRRCIELIASENIASSAVIACMGTVLTNKYAEGLPAKRYYGGCEVVVPYDRGLRPRRRARPLGAPVQELPNSYQLVRLPCLPLRGRRRHSSALQRLSIIHCSLLVIS